MPSKLRAAALGLLALQCALAAQTAAAVPPTFGPVLRLNEGDPGCLVDPVTVPLRSGGFAVAWNESASYIPANATLRFADRLGRLGPERHFPGRQVETLGTDAAAILSVVWHTGTELRLQRFSA